MTSRKAGVSSTDFLFLTRVIKTSLTPVLRDVILRKIDFPQNRGEVNRFFVLTRVIKTYLTPVLRDVILHKIDFPETGMTRSIQEKTSARKGHPSDRPTTFRQTQEPGARRELHITKGNRLAPHGDKEPKKIPRPRYLLPRKRPPRFCGTPSANR